MRYASLASGGSLGKSRVTLPDVVRVSPDGCIIVLGGKVVMLLCAGACGVRRDMFAVVSRSEVLFKLGRLAQPGVR